MQDKSSINGSLREKKAQGHSTLGERIVNIPFLSNPGIKPRSPALQGGLYHLSHQDAIIFFRCY